MVTIVLAGIVFAAMVPVFVGAQQKASGDQVRNAALNLAQDRVEKIRQLPFDQACDAAKIAASLGTTWNSYNGSSTRKYSIAYTSVPGGGTSPTFTTVGVEVWWQAPPSPVKRVKVKTIIVNNEMAAVAPSPSSSATPSASPSPSPSATPSASPSPSSSPSPSPSATAYPNKKYSLTFSTNEWYGHKVHLYQTNVTPAVDLGTKEFNGNTSATWKNIPSGAYRAEHTFGWWDFVTEVSTVYLTSNLTLRYDGYNSQYPGH
jgi:hypothetical protein